MKRREFLSWLGFGTIATALNPTVLLPSPASCEVYPGYPVPFFTGFKRAQDTTTLAGQFLWSVLWENDEKTDMTYWFQSCTIPEEVLQYRPTGRLTWFRGHGHGAKQIDAPSMKTVAQQRPRWVNGEIPYDRWQADDVWSRQERVLTEESVKLIRSNIARGFSSYVAIIDGIVDKAQRGLVETTENPICEPNPDYDPNHFNEHDGDGDDGYGCRLCMKVLQVANRDIPVKRVRLFDWNRIENGGRKLSDLWNVEQPSVDPLNIAAIIDGLTTIGASSA